MTKFESAALIKKTINLPPPGIYSRSKKVLEKYTPFKNIRKIPTPSLPYSTRPNILNPIVLVLSTLMYCQPKYRNKSNLSTRHQIVVRLQEICAAAWLRTMLSLYTARGMRSGKIKMVAVAKNLDPCFFLSRRVMAIFNLKR